MATTQDYADFIAGQFQGLEGFRMRRMFGGYSLYIQGRVLGFIFDNEFLMEDGPIAQKLMPDAKRKELFPGSKLFVVFDNVDNARYMQQIALSVYEDLPIPKPRKSDRKASGDSPRGKSTGDSREKDGNGSRAKGNGVADSNDKSEGQLPEEILDFLSFHRNQ